MVLNDNRKQIDSSVTEKLYKVKDSISHEIENDHYDRKHDRGLVFDKDNTSWLAREHLHLRKNLRMKG